MTLYNALPQYEKFSISNEETIDSGFTGFNAIMTSLKSLDLDYSSKNHVRKFLRDLPLKWRAKIIKEKVKSLALKAKVTREQTSDDSDSQDGSDKDEEINLIAKNFRRLFQEDPKVSHLEAVKRIFGYVKRTQQLGLWYPKDMGVNVLVYAHSDHAGDVVDKKSQVEFAHLWDLA
ncbi:hypothetical protein Tco_0524730 [Tanacetum coccineum]